MEQTKSIIRATMLRELGLDFGLIEPCLNLPKSQAECSRNPPPVDQTAPKARAGCSRDPQPLDQMASKSAVDVLADRLWERYFTPKDIGLEESFKGPEFDSLINSCDWAGLAKCLAYDREEVYKYLPLDQACLIVDGMSRVANQYFLLLSPLSHKVYRLSPYAERLTHQALLRDWETCGKAGLLMSFEERYGTQFAEILQFLNSFEVPVINPTEKHWRDAAMVELKQAYGERNEEGFREVYSDLRMLAGQIRARVVNEFKLVDY